MRIPEVNVTNTESLQTLLAGNRYICGIAPEAESCGQCHGAKFGGEEDILALLGIVGQPSGDDFLGVALGGVSCQRHATVR